MLTINTSASGTSETDGRNEKAKKAGSGETSETSETSGTGGRNEKAVRAGSGATGGSGERE